MSAHRPSARASAPPKGPQLTRHGLQLGERTVPLLCGAVHYFRLPRASWQQALESVRDLGLSIVESYVPWGVHELDGGSYDFGEQDSRKDLAAFLDLVQELGLFAFIRPGPHINAELTYFGLPRRVVFDERNQALSPRGKPLPIIAPPRMFPVPSYASRNFHAQVGEWMQAVGKIVGERRWPNGPVVLLQVDNEAAFYFRDAPYDSDYHEDAIAQHTRFLERRYRSIDALNRVYGTSHAAFGEVTPPLRFEARSRLDLPRHLDWVEFQETLICDALELMRKQMCDAGMSGLPVVHNLPMGDFGLPTSITAVERSADLTGLDYYHGRTGLDGVRKRTLRLAGTTRHAFAPELGVGAPPWFAPRSDADALHSTLVACAYGLRGMNLYMAVDRDRWYGAPIDGNGEPRASAQRWRRLLASLRRTEFHRLRRRARVALCVPREYARLSRATHALGALSPSLLDLAGLPASAACRNDRFGFARPIQLAWEPLLARLDHALCEEQIPFVYVDGDAELDALPELQLVFAPAFELADGARWERLLRFAARGGTVCFGPELPMFDQQLRPADFRAHGLRGPLPLHAAGEVSQLVRELALELALERPFAVGPQPLTTTVHEDEHGPRVLFVVHPGALELRAEVQLPHALRFIDAISEERFHGETTLELPMAAHSCRMLIVEREP